METATRDTVVELSNVDVQFRRHDGSFVTACQNVSFAVRDQEFVSIVGPSGCGKSTTLRIIAGLLAPARGSVAIRGQSLEGRIADNLAMMFQSPVLLDWRTVIDNVGLPLEVAGVRRKEARERARRLLDLTGLAAFETARPFELSGGMQQRVALCRALVTEPDILLMDEPFGALDALTRGQMGAMLQDVWIKQRIAVVFVTHSVREAVSLSDRVLVMSSRPGTIVRECTIDLPRPRDRQVRRATRFQDYVEEISGLLGVSDGAD